MFSILRIVIGIVISTCIIILLFKYRKITLFLFSVVMVFAIILVTVLGFFPFENLLYNFKSAEDVYKYYYYGETSVDITVKGKESDFVVGTKNNVPHYLIVAKKTDCWKLGIGIDAKIIQHISIDGIVINIYKYKKANDYYISILNTNPGPLEVSDNCGSNFQSLCKKNDTNSETFYTYYAYIKTFDNKYILFENGNEINFSVE